MTPARARRRWAVWLVWLGIALCGGVIFRDRGRMLEALGAFGPEGAIALAALFLLVWSCAVESWRNMLLAFSGQAVARTVAARHLALLLLGKYVPGGVWGFLARFVDSASGVPRGAALQAGIAEQAAGLLALSLVSAASLGFMNAPSIGWVLVLPVVPVLVFGASRSLDRAMPIFGAVATRISSRIGEWQNGSGLQPRPLWTASLLMCLQQVAILAITALIAQLVVGVAWPQAIAVSGAYGISIALGVLAIVVPGGMLVREAAFVALSSPWLPTEQGVLLAALFRLAFTVFDLLTGFLAAGTRFLGARHDRG